MYVHYAVKFDITRGIFLGSVDLIVSATHGPIYQKT